MIKGYTSFNQNNVNPRENNVKAMRESGYYGSSGKTCRVQSVDPYLLTHSYKQDPLNLRILCLRCYEIENRIHYVRISYKGI